MKTLNIIICLLAVTLFVACSKKKDGDSNPYYGNPYGLTPNDIRGGIPNQGIYPQQGLAVQPVMPGYQLPQTCGSGQLFPDAVSYCGWLATEGEQACNPIQVKQLFLQYCQQFATQYNYCVQQVQSGCYYGSGCNVGTSVIRYHDSKRPRDSQTYTGDQDSGIPVQQKQSCEPNKAADCKVKNKKKSTEVVCKLPNDSASEENYLYTYEEYVDAVQKMDCTPAQSSTTYVKPTGVAQNTVAPTTTYVKPTQTTTYTQPTQVAQDNTVRLQPTAVNDDKVRPGVPTSKVVYINADGTPKTTMTQTKVDLPKSACLNLQTLHEGFLNGANHISSYELTYTKKLNSTSDQKMKESFYDDFANYWTSSYHGNKEGQGGTLTAFGSNVKQTSSTLSVDNKTAQITSCTDKQLTVKFKTRFGDEIIRYQWNGSMEEKEFEILVNRTGSFSYNGKSDTFQISSFIGIARDRANEIKANDQWLHQFVLATMQSKGIRLEDTSRK